MCSAARTASKSAARRCRRCSGPDRGWTVRTFGISFCCGGARTAAVSSAVWTVGSFGVSLWRGGTRTTLEWSTGMGGCGWTVRPFGISFCCGGARTAAVSSAVWTVGSFGVSLWRGGTRTTLEYSTGMGGCGWTVRPFRISFRHVGASTAAVSSASTVGSFGVSLWCRGTRAARICSTRAGSCGCTIRPFRISFRHVGARTATVSSAIFNRDC